MLIDLYGTVKEDKIEFNLPIMYFLGGHYIKINQLYIKWHRKANDMYGTINTTLIEKNDCNLRQQLLFFYQNTSSYVTYVSPTHSSSYKIQRQALHSSEFNLQLSKPEKIEIIYIQLEITDERL